MPDLAFFVAASRSKKNLNLSTNMILQKAITIFVSDWFTQMKQIFTENAKKKRIPWKIQIQNATKLITSFQVAAFIGEVRILKRIMNLLNLLVFILLFSECLFKNPLHCVTGLLIEELSEILQRIRFRIYRTI